MMNPAERIVATYLRLNGFLLLPHFTTFGGGYHNHMDLLGLRAPGSIERVEDITFPLDDAFFAALPDQFGECPQRVLLGLVAEVRTNRTVDIPDADHITYASTFLGGAPVVPISFSDSTTDPRWNNGRLEASNRYALEWIIERIRWMDKHHRGLTKSGSWPWSEDSLAELLVLYRYGAFPIPGTPAGRGSK